MLKQYSLKALEKAMNHALALDQQMPLKLSRLQGKILEMKITPLGINFFILFNDKRIELRDQINGQADTSIHSSPIGLIRLSLLPASKARSLFNDNVKIYGNLDFGREVKTLFDEIDIDWEGHLAQFTGDVAAHQIGRLFRKGRAFTRQFNDSMQQNLTDYLQEELHLFPTREEVEDFFSDIDELSLDVERLQAYIEQLMVKHEIN